MRLGIDSEDVIKKIDACHSYSSLPFYISVKCKQVPKDIGLNDISIIWLGTNNKKGGKTPWTQGIRALGKILDISGGVEYSDTKTVHVEIGVTLPRSITKMDIVTQQSKLYSEIAAMPVLGVNNYSSQVIQKINSLDESQSISSLFSALEDISPGFKSAALDFEPRLYDNFINPSHLKYKMMHSEIDADGLEPDGDRDSDTHIEVPFNPSKIDIIAKAMTISSLEDRLENYELDLTPDFQRQANIWDNKRKSRLIESILLNIPLPSFYFSEDRNGGYAVVDGLQRLCAIFHFKNVKILNFATGTEYPPLKLVGLQYLKDIEECTFQELDRKFQRRISELEISTNIIRANTPAAVKFNVFARLNQGGMPLNAQEIRNAIFPGHWRDILRNLADSKEFRTATEDKIQRLRQQDMELVLRFICLWQLDAPYNRPSGQTLDEFLNYTVEKILSQWDDSQWEEARNAFFHAIDATYKVFGKHSFRKSIGDQQRKPINRGLFEAELIVFGSLNEKNLSKIISNKVFFEKYFKEALDFDTAFVQSLLYGTGSAESSNARINALKRICNEV